MSRSLQQALQITQRIRGNQLCDRLAAGKRHRITTAFMHIPTLPREAGASGLPTIARYPPLKDHMEHTDFPEKRGERLWI